MSRHLVNELINCYTESSGRKIANMCSEISVLKDGKWPFITVNFRPCGRKITPISKTLVFEHWKKTHFLLNICTIIMCCSINVGI